MKRLMIVLSACVIGGMCPMQVSAAAIGGSIYAAAPGSAHGTLQNGGAWEYKDGVMTFSGEGRLFASMEEQTAYRAFAEEAEKVVIGEGITEISGSFFQGFTALTAVTLPASLTSIGTMAFSCCGELREINLSPDLQFGASAFEFCPNLFRETYPWQIIDTTLIGYAIHPLEMTETVLEVPSGVTRIAASAFSGNTGVTEIVLPESVTEIGSSAFAGCTQLTRAVLPDALRVIPGGAFSGCKRLAEIALPAALETIGDNAFRSCGLTQLVLPASLTAIGHTAFYDCTRLRTVEGGENVRQIYADSFENCTALDMDAPLFDALKRQGYLLAYRGQEPEVSIAAGTRTVMSNAFKGNTAVVAIACPESLRELGASCFANCTELIDLRLNDGLTSIGMNAIAGCTSLTSLTIPASVTEIGLQVPCSLTDIYGVSGSAAEAFAKQNLIAFHSVEAPAARDDLAFDFASDGWQFGNFSKHFGEGYSLTDRDAVLLARYGIGSDKTAAAWEGSCFGMALSAVLAKHGLLPLGRLQQGAASLREVEPSARVISYINYCHFLQYTPEFTAAITGSSAAQKFYRMRTALGEQGAAPFLVQLELSSGRHAVIAYGRESGEWTFGDRTYAERFLIWDSNAPEAFSADCCLYYDPLTYDWHIPAYGATGTRASCVYFASDDPALLSAYAYPFEASALRGDADCDGDVALADAVLLAKVVGMVDGAELSAQGRANADLDNSGIIDSADLILMLCDLAGST